MLIVSLRGLIIWIKVVSLIGCSGLNATIFCHLKVTFRVAHEEIIKNAVTLILNWYPAGVKKV